MSDFEPFVSIVIPVYNAQDTIEAVINACLKQEYPKQKLEIIVVDDGSTDRTREVVKRFAVKYIYQERGGPAKARNKGWRESVGDIICFTDSDCIPSRDWVFSLISKFIRQDIGVVCGSYEIINKEGLLVDCIWREIKYRHSLMPDFVRSFGSYNFSAKKEVLEKVGGFNESYTSASGEDNDLAYKILKAGFKIYFERSIKVRHYFPKELSRYLYEQYQHGFWRTRLYRSHPKMILGDDYTRLKDALEPILVSITIFLSIFTWIECRINLLLLVLVIFYIALQLMVAFKICLQDKTFKYLYLAYIASLRGLARTIGMWKGLWSLV